MLRRTGFREQYYTGKRGYNTAREEYRQYQGEIICTFLMAIHQYLQIYQFVWAEFVCGTRKHRYASVDRNGIIQKIHMRKYR